MVSPLKAWKMEEGPIAEIIYRVWSDVKTNSQGRGKGLQTPKNPMERSEEFLTNRNNRSPKKRKNNDGKNFTSRCGTNRFKKTLRGGEEENVNTPHTKGKRRASQD